MHDESVQLRPIEEADLGMLRRLHTDPSMCEPFSWAGYRDPHLFRRRWEEDGWLGRESSMLAVGLAGDLLAGIVSWRAIRTAPEGTCLEIGILLVPEHRGRGVGTQAQRLLAEYLFAYTLANRLQATTDTENIVEQRALERVGFRREGVMRGVAFAGGRWRDGVMYGRLRNDPV